MRSFCTTSIIGTACSLPGPKDLVSQHMGTVLLRIDNNPAVYNIDHSERLHSLNTAMQPSPGNLGIVLAKTDNTAGRTSAEPTQLSDRFRVQDTKGSIRLDDQLCGVSTNPTLFWPLQIDLFASCLTKELPQYYSWRPDPEAAATDAFTQKLSSQIDSSFPS